MSTENILLKVVISVACIGIGFLLVHLGWRAVGAWNIHRAGTRPLDTVRHVLWRDPGPVATLDLRIGPGGADFMPRPPFRFNQEHFGGSQPCVSVTDARGRRWRVKWG